VAKHKENKFRKLARQSRPKLIFAQDPWRFGM